MTCVRSVLDQSWVMTLTIDRITHDREKNLFWLHYEEHYVGSVNAKAIVNEIKDWLEQRGFGQNIVLNIDICADSLEHLKVSVSFIEPQDSTMMKLMCDEF